MREYQKFPANAVRICIDSDCDQMSGRAYTPLRDGEIKFTDVQELLLKLDQIFEQMGYPQAFTEIRSFEKTVSRKGPYRGIPRIDTDIREIINQQGLCRTYDIVIQSRRNTSWQGILYDRIENVSQDFHGEIELLKGLSTI